MDGDLSVAEPVARATATSSFSAEASPGWRPRIVFDTPHRDVRITLIEAEDRLGGKILTERSEGFLIEGGPDSFLATKPRGVGLCAEVGIADRLQGVTPRRRRAFVLSQGRLHDLPEGLSGLVPTRLAPLARSTLLSPAGKARVALDYVLPAASRPTTMNHSVASFAGAWGAKRGNAWSNRSWPASTPPMATISVWRRHFPSSGTPSCEHGGLIKGVLAARRSQPFSDTTLVSPFLTPSGGLGALVAAVANRLRTGGVEIRLSATATAIHPGPSGYQIRLSGTDAILADAVIVATPSFAAAKLVRGFDPELAAELDAIPHASTAIVTLAYRRDEIPHPLDGHGYVVPRVEGGSILACTWSSRKWAGRAPSGWELIRVFIGRSGQDDILAADDESLVALAREELATRLGIKATPSLQRVTRWPRGMPQYVLGHPRRLARIDAALNRHPGLYLAGNAYRGVGLPDCIASGERAAEAAAEYLRTLSLGG